MAYYDGHAAYLTRDLIFKQLKESDYKQEVFVSYEQLKELFYF